MLVNPSKSNYNSVKILSIFEDVALGNQLVEFNSSQKIEGYDYQHSKVLVIKSGIVKLCLRRNSGYIILGFCMRGDMLSSSLINGNNSSYSVETVSKVTAYSWELSKINEVADLFPDIKSMLHSNYDTWNLWLVNRIESIALLSAKERVEKWLSDYVKIIEYRNSDLWNKLSTLDMAAYCAVSVGEFTFHLNQLIESGAAEIRNNIPRLVTS